MLYHVSTLYPALGRFRGSRAQVRERTAAVALNTLRRMLLGEHLS